MIRLGTALLSIALVIPPAAAAGQEAPDLGQVLRDFGLRSNVDGLDLLVVHLNDKTTDALFEAPAKYSFRAQARQVTMFYVLGTPDRPITVTTDFRIRQEAIDVRFTPHSLSNFEEGTEVGPGETFSGILALNQILSLRIPFSIVSPPASCGAENRRGCHVFEFEFTPNILSQLDAP